MKTNPNKLQIMSMVSNLITPSLSKETNSLISLGRSNGWDFMVIGRAPIPTHPVQVGEWLLVPAEQETSPLPPRTFERIQNIFASGIRPAGFIIAHEAPALLPPKVRPIEEPIKWSILSPQHKRMMNLALGAILVVTLGIAILPIILGILALAAGVVGAMLIPAALFAGIAIDPILIAVTQDGYWIEIDRWWNE